MELRGNQGRASCTGMRGGAFTVQSGTQRVWVFMCRRWVYGGREHLDLPLAQRSHVRSLCCARGARLSHARACVAARASDGGGVYQTDLRESCTVESVARGAAHATRELHGRERRSRGRACTRKRTRTRTHTRTHLASAIAQVWATRRVGAASFCRWQTCPRLAGKSALRPPRCLASRPCLRCSRLDPAAAFARPAARNATRWPQVRRCCGVFVPTVELALFWGSDKLPRLY